MWHASTMRLAQFALPVAVVALGYALIVARGWSVDHELQLVMPETVRPADPIPVRALVFADIDAPAGATLTGARVRLEVDDRNVDLESYEVNGFEFGATVLAPFRVPGAFVVRASALDANGEIVATASRRVSVRAGAEPTAVTPREGFQHLRRIGARRMEVGVEGGVCIPERPCSVLVRSSTERVSVEDDAVDVLETEVVEDGLHRVSLAIHGPEAEIDLVGWEDGVEIERQRLQLPVALATPWMEIPRSVREEVLEVRSAPPPGRHALVADVFETGHWVGSAVLSDDNAGIAVASPGLYRVELRIDPFGGDRAASRYVRYRESSAAVQDEGAGSVDPRGDVASEIGQALAAEGIDAGSGPGRLLLARAEEQVRVLPRAVSGLEADLERLRHRRGRVYRLSAIGIAVGILVFSLTLFWRGWGAASEAREVMVQASGEPVRARILPVIAIVATIAVSWIAGAAMLLIRAMLGQP